MFSLNATLPVFLVMVIGWALGQKGFLPKQFCTVADKLVFKVTLPVMLFCDMATLDLAHSFDAKFVLFCFAVTAIAIVVIWVLARPEWPRCCGSWPVRTHPPGFYLSIGGAPAPR